MNNTVFKKSQVVVSRPLAPETLVVPIKAGSANLNEVYLLNELASRVWQLIDGRHSVAQIASLITEEYEVSHEQALADVAELVAQLERLNVVIKPTV